MGALTVRHFTYSTELDRESLKQGDVLCKSDELCDLLKEYHSYYVRSSEYTHFQILTQTCDLVRRGESKQCSTRYITIAAVRSLDTVIKRSIDRYADKKVLVEDQIYCSEKHKSKLKAEASSLFNNNDRDHFFLKASPSDGLPDDSCTFLHLSIALRAYEHYDLCLRAKLLELEGSFRAKLGWMVGNLYSRVGTEDYVPGASPTKESFEAEIEKILEKYIGWVPEEAFTEFKKSAQVGRSFEEILKVAEESRQGQRTQRIKSLAGLLEKHAGLSLEQRMKVREFLESTQGKAFLK